MSFAFRVEEPPPEIKAHFADTPWAKLFDDPNLEAFSNRFNESYDHPSFDTFMRKTLATKDTIKAWQSFRKLGTEYTQNLVVISIGSGVNGHTDTCHGGFLGVILDEVLGNAAECERPRDKATMTAFLKVDYKKPVRTPGKILCRGNVEKKEGRKMWVRGVIEDGQGTVYAIAEGLFLVVEQVKPLEKL
jgi:acyl-coenzyme A thioesterase PaaI-like protein